jgi:hypothetical protein
MNKCLHILVVVLCLSGCGKATRPASSAIQDDGEALSKETITELLQNETLNPEGVSRINAKLKQEGNWGCLLHPHTHNEYGTCSAVTLTNDTWAIVVHKIAQADGTHELKITHGRRKK